MRSSESRIRSLYILVSKCAIVIVVSDLASFVMAISVKQKRTRTHSVHLYLFLGGEKRDSLRK